MKFTILKDQKSSVYENNGIDIDIDDSKWSAWYDYNTRNIKEGNHESMCYDVDECQVCGVMTKEHLIDFLEYSL